MASKMRSPNYPGLSLAQAVEAAVKIWEGEKRTAVSHETAAQAMGYKALSGPARVAIGSLRQYGLIDKAEHGHVRLSDLAVRLLHGDAADRAKAQTEAALNPPLFKELAESHPDGSENSIRSHLITKKGFAEDGARKAAKAFRDTLGLANWGASGYTATQTQEKPQAMSVTESGQSLNKVDAPGFLSLSVPLATGNLTVQVRLTGDTLKPAHLARVRKYLEMAEEDLKSVEHGSADSQRPSHQSRGVRIRDDGDK